VGLYSYYGVRGNVLWKQAELKSRAGRGNMIKGENNQRLIHSSQEERQGEERDGLRPYPTILRNGTENDIHIAELIAHKSRYYYNRDRSFVFEHQYYAYPFLRG